MKNSLPCEIVRDLLPCYVEGLSSNITSTAVREHLTECSECKRISDNMKSGAKDSKQINEACENNDEQLFKKIKKKLNRRTKTIICTAIVTVAAIAASFYISFTAPIKNLDLSDVTVSAKVYPTSELEKNSAAQDENNSSTATNDTEIKISQATDDNSETFQVTIPDIDNDGIMITGNTLNKSEYVTVVTWSSSYFLREIKYASEEYQKNTDTIYVSAFKTTLFNNKAQEYQAKMTQLEFSKINKIVFVNENGQESILWENKDE